MKKEKQEQILKEFPEFFDYLSENEKIQTSDNPVEVVNNLINQNTMVLPIQFGFECEDGWFRILYGTLKCVQKYCKWNDVEYPKITQVKEKYGVLEIYHHGGDQMTDGMFWLASDLSNYTCEFCGTNENVGKTEGWIYTICKSCYDKKSEAQNLPWKLV